MATSGMTFEEGVNALAFCDGFRRSRGRLPLTAIMFELCRSLRAVGVKEVPESLWGQSRLKCAIYRPH